MRELRKASLRLLIILSVITGCWASISGATLARISPPASPQTANA